VRISTHAQFLFMKLKRFTKQQVIEFAKKNVATNDYAFGERSGKYIVTMKYSIEEMKKWVELDEMKSKIRKVFASDAKTNEISGDDIKAIYKIIFKDKK